MRGLVEGETTTCEQDTQFPSGWLMFVVGDLRGKENSNFADRVPPRHSNSMAGCAKSVKSLFFPHPSVWGVLAGLLRLGAPRASLGLILEVSGEFEDPTT